MTVNISALMALLQAKGERIPSNHPKASAFTIRGPLPYDTIMKLWPREEMLSSELVTAIENVRADTRWGPVFDGDLSSFGDDHSRADLALCGEFARRGLTAGTIGMAIRASKLYRDKWDRSDYRDRTIALAMNAKSPSQDTVEKAVLCQQNGKVSICMSDPRPRDWVLEGVLLSAKAAVLGGFGGVSKTQFVIQLAISVALGVPFMGKSVNAGRVMLLLGEEDQEEITRRISAVARKENFSTEQVTKIEAQISAYGLIGVDARLTAKKDRELKETDFAREIIERANAINDVRLIVFDHIALFHGGDFIAREEAALTMRVVAHIAKETGAAVLVLTHTPKGAVAQEKSDASMIAGSTAFVDQARGAMVLATMRDNETQKYGIAKEERQSYVSLAIVKSNYGPTGDIHWFKREQFDGVGLLEHVRLTSPLSGPKRTQDLEARLIEFVRCHPGQYSKTRLRDTKARKTGVFQASKGEVEGALEALISKDQIANRAPTEAEREKFGHGPRVKHVLDVWTKNET